MTEVFVGNMAVHYGFIYLSADGDVGDDLVDAARGQQNGLCGALVPHQLSLITGLHTGEVGLTVEWLPEEPPIDLAWEEVVEVSFEVPRHDLVLSSFEIYLDVRVPATGEHRARYCAVNMDAGRQLDTTEEDDEPGPDRYLLQLWPAPIEPERIVRQTSEIAAYWHSVAGG